MCGIAGIIAPRAEQYREELDRMLDSLGHRGPDDSGSHFFKGCALGHRRLSIVDLVTGRQPMVSAGAGITFNGEIYGYKEIRAALTDYAFTTASDTEVILALYHRYGNEFLSRLPGMFAFAIWDDARRKLFCARDRFGEKPFYYAWGPNGEFLFASEIKALLASRLVSPVLNLEAVSHYIKYLYVHPHQTIYRNIHTLPPAHTLQWRDSKVSIERYWKLPETRNEIALPAAVEQFKELYERSLARQLVADVPVGAFLSGGLDSSTVVAVASRYHPRLKTFSFNFEDSASELPFAREVATRYKTEHIELADKNSDIGELLVTMQKVFDEPFADSSNIPTYLISKLAREHVKVVLTGDGGDELLGGYSFWYQPLLAMQQSQGHSYWLSAALRLSRLLRKRVNPALAYRAQGSKMYRRFGSIAGAHAAQKEYFTDGELGTMGLPPAYVHSTLYDSSHTIDDAMRLDLDGYMPGDILVKIDRSSMAHGLELRAPFLDVNFAEFCISLPWTLKIKNGEDKLILRKAYEDAWPLSVRNRGKQGFGAPVGKWLKRDSVRMLKKQYLDDPNLKIYALLPYKDTKYFVRGNDYRTWILLVLSLWMEMHEYQMS